MRSVIGSGRRIGIRVPLPERAAVSVHTAFPRLFSRGRTAKWPGNQAARQSGNPRARSRCLSGPSLVGAGRGFKAAARSSPLSRSLECRTLGSFGVGGVGGSVSSGQTGWEHSEHPEPKESKSPREAVRGPGQDRELLGTAEPPGLVSTRQADAGARCGQGKSEAEPRSSSGGGGLQELRRTGEPSRGTFVSPLVRQGEKTKQQVAVKRRTPQTGGSHRRWAQQTRKGS
ncbi:hypothetical protein NDU88_008192 [Pleurodeles waltl]|uniref:Uncharacterized protein n=1 Tax=Pleurodeles waltl TaxID=8319 RepID=A0AAV7NYF9_PLEWA|nr:hypothetical protein NDU88_008192 [Pleurodeles waltl]